MLLILNARVVFCTISITGRHVVRSSEKRTHEWRKLRNAKLLAYEVDRKGGDRSHASTDTPVGPFVISDRDDSDDDENEASLANNRGGRGDAEDSEKDFKWEEAAEPFTSLVIDEACQLNEVRRAQTQL